VLDDAPRDCGGAGHARTGFWIASRGSVGSAPSASAMPPSFSSAGCASCCAVNAHWSENVPDSSRASARAGSRVGIRLFDRRVRRSRLDHHDSRERTEHRAYRHECQRELPAEPRGLFCCLTGAGAFQAGLRGRATALVGTRAAELDSISIDPRVQRSEATGIDSRSPWMSGTRRPRSCCDVVHSLLTCG